MLSDVHCGVYMSLYCYPVESAMPTAQVDYDHLLFVGPFGIAVNMNPFFTKLKH